jgi:hypothetical protein
MVATAPRSLPLSAGPMLWPAVPGLVPGLTVGLLAALLPGTVVGIPAAFVLLARLPRLAWLAVPPSGDADAPRMPGLC